MNGKFDRLNSSDDDGQTNPISNNQSNHDEQFRMRGEILEHINEAVGAIDNEGRITFINAAAERMYRVRACDVIGRHYSEVYTRRWPSSEAEAHSLEDLHEFGHSRWELDHITHDGREISVEVGVALFRDDWGNPIGTIAAIRDISDRNRVEKQLHNNEQFTRRVLDNLFAFVGVMSTDGTLVEANRAPLEAAGIDASEVIGKKFWDCYWWNYSSEAQDRLRKWCELAARGEVVRCDVPVRMADDKQMWIDFQLAPLRDADGKITHLIPSAMDISARIEVESALRAREDQLRQNAQLFSRIVEQAPTGMYVVDSDFRFQQVNALAAPVFSNIEPLVGRDINEVMEILWGPEVGAFVANIFRHTLETGERYVSPSFIYDRFDIGEEQAYDWETQRVTLADGKHGVVCYFHDVTEREKSARALRESDERFRMLADKLSDADRRKDEFLATLAHELRNPLAPISNALQVMRLSGQLEGDSVELQEIMERQVSHLIRLVDDLMEVSRISSGKIELRKGEVELSSILQTAVEICKPRIDENQHELTVSLPSEPILLNADQVRLSQVIANLLTNSAKYMDTGGKIDITASLDGDRVNITVSDTGLGIPRDMLKHVFEMFMQMEHTRRHTHGGLGIGLALAKNLVEMHGGSIHAFSEGVGQGCQFVVSLPILSAQSNSLDSSTSPSVKPSLSKRRILVVDDMKMARVTLEKLLTLMDQEVYTFPSAQSAIDFAMNNRPDVIISDIGMPEIDGYELARRIRSHEELKNVVLVALTGYGQSNDRQLAADAGFDRHLTKPVNVEELRSLLSSFPILPTD